MIKHHLNKENLHHAYLLEGEKGKLVEEVVSFFESSGIKISNNPDFIQINQDVFKVDDARILKTHAAEQGLSDERNAKKIFIVSANNFLLEAQNSLLKLFEEPIPNTHFFIIAPDLSVFIKTLISRLYIIRSSQELKDESREAEKFIQMTTKARIDFVKELLAEDEDQDDSSPVTDSARSKSLRFLNALETILHVKIPKTNVDVFEHFFKVRKFLRQPGSSPKTLMESVALIVPNFSK